MTAPTIFFSVKLISKVMVTSEVMVLRFTKPPGFNFIPGQFVQFRVPVSGAAVLRPYSISALPKKEFLEFCAKIIPQGKASIFFSQLNLGDSADISKAQGLFICKKNYSKQNFFFATGVGVAPLYPMIAELLSKDETGQVNLFFGVRFSQDIFWQERFEELKARYNNFNYVITLSKPAEDWPGSIGRVYEYIHDPAPQADYYLCGSLAMVKDVRTLLIKKGMPRQKIHFEIFS